MSPFYHLVIFNLLTLLQICLTIHSHIKPLPLWSWECVDGKCVPIKATHAIHLQSLITCNILCSSLQFWPQPTGHISFSPTAVSINVDLPKLTITSSPSKLVSSHVRKAFKIFRNYLLNIAKKNETEGIALLVNIAINGDGDPRMRRDTDESYNLQLQSTNDTESSLVVDIKAKSFCGSRHALETLSQLIWYDPYAKSLFIIKSGTIEDKPVFRYRGLMIDTAQNFFTLQELYRMLDTMATCKLNTFHWRITNSYSFPFLMENVPQFAQLISKDSGLMYTTNDVSEITKYARLRGIRVILEVNLPIFVVKPWPTSLLEDHEPEYCRHIPENTLLNTLKPIYEEIISITGVDDVFHFGNDDLYESCKIDNHNATNSKDLWLSFTLKSLQTLESANRGKLPSLTILRFLQSTDQLKLALKQFVTNIGIQIHNVSWVKTHTSGIKTIISHEDAWDLNNGYGAWTENSKSLPYNSWQRVYEHRPWARKGIELIEGGEATVWSSILDSSELESYVWPRVAALAERLWSDRAEGATRLVHARMDVYRTRLVLRGIQASPLWSMWCTHNPFTC